MMGTRSYTILVLPDGSSSARALHVSRTTIAAITTVAVLCLSGVMLLFSQCADLKGRIGELQRARHDAAESRVLADAIGRFERELSRTRDLNRDVRLVAGLDKGVDEPGMGAQGGADAGSQGSLRDAVQRQAVGLVDWLNGEVASVGEEIVSRERGLRALQTYFNDKAAIRAATPTILPVKGSVTAGFGYRSSPFTGHREFHEGLDIAVTFGTPIRATADGVVSFSGPLATYGNVVFIDHGHGYSTGYAHNSVNKVRVRQRVRRGDIIAYVGTTGRSTGAHVHYEVYFHGVPSNPLEYAMDTSGVRLATGPQPDHSSRALLKTASSDVGS